MLLQCDPLSGEEQRALPPTPGLATQPSGPPLHLPALLQRGALNAVAEQHQMVRLHRLRLLANFIVKGADQKSASTSSIAKLPVHKVGAWGH